MLAIGFEDGIDRKCHDQRLNRIKRSDEPLDRTDTRCRTGGDQLPGPLCNPQHNRARFNDLDLVVAVGWYLPERLLAAMLGRLGVRISTIS